MQEKETHERKKECCRWVLWHHTLVCDNSAVPNQVLAPAAIFSMWRAGNHLWWGEKKEKIKETKMEGITSYFLANSLAEG